MKHFCSLVTFLISLTAVNAQNTPSQILEDLDQLQELIQQKHVSPYWNSSEVLFAEVIQQAKSNIQQKDSCDVSCYTALFKIVAALRESHSYVSSKSRYALMGYLPISIKWLEDGLYVTKAAAEYEDILGHKIAAINGMDIAAVLARIRTVLPHSNESRIKKYAGSYIHLPGLLFGLGITNSPQQARITFLKSGKQIEQTIRDLPPHEEEQTVFKSISTTSAYFQKNTDRYYWFDYESDQKLLYFQYNRIGNMDSESSTAFANRLWATVDSVDIDKFVLDLRYNGGGSFPYSLKFIQGIIDRPKINRRGKLFVVTGYDTFSAAITMVNQLEQRTQALIVGDYPCASPAHPGDPEDYTLKHSGMTVSLSSLYHPTIFPGDSRPATILDQHILSNWEDYKKGIDPIMDYIIHYDEEEIEPASVNGYREYLGRYEYSSTRQIKLQDVDDQLWLKIDHALVTPLFQQKGATFATEIQGLTVTLTDGLLVVNFPDGSSENFTKVGDPSISALGLLYRGDFEEAEAIYSKIKASDPDFIEIKDHQMSFLASILYFDLLKSPDADASGIAKGILDLGIKLNDGNAPFCEFALRFY